MREPSALDIGLLASIGINLGQNIQNTYGEDPDRRTAWFIGFVIFVASRRSPTLWPSRRRTRIRVRATGGRSVSSLSPISNFVYGLVTRNKVLYNRTAKPISKIRPLGIF